MPIYLDHAATTPVRREVVDAMLPFLTEAYGNPSSAHAFGRAARAALDDAHDRLASSLGVEAREVVFTSGGTEANNLALKGAAWAGKARGHRIVTSSIEHHAVGHALRYLEKFGFEIVELPVDRYGRVDPDELDAALSDRTILVSIMLANNEIGTIQAIAELSKIAKERGVLFHTDATEAVGKIPVDVEKMGIDLLSCTAHKIYGPKGIGALYVRRRNPRVRLAPMIDGGGHERGSRSGTVPVPLAVGFGRAAEICREVMPEEAPRLARMRDRLQDRILSSVDEAYLNGHPERRLPHTLNISFAYVEGESILMGLNKEVALSSGSACTSSTLEPSYVIQALGVGADLAHSSIRYGLHRFTTEEEVDFVAGKTIDVVKRLREMSPLYELAKEGVDIKSIQWKAE